nr:MAG TPA: hypothetical protein [Caudoviricetes sp.]
MERNPPRFFCAIFISSLAVRARSARTEFWSIHKLHNFFPVILCNLTKKLFPEIIDNNHPICYNNTCQEGVAQEIQGRATLRK